jgi:hypothetical protein
VAGDVRQVQVDGSDESWGRVTDEFDERWVEADGSALTATPGSPGLTGPYT